MKRSFLFRGLILVSVMACLACGKIYKNGDLKIKIVKAKWEQIFMGDMRTPDKYLVIAVNVYWPGSNDRPSLPMSVRDESGESYFQASSRLTYHGRKTRIDTSFMVSETKKQLYLIAAGFDPIPISPK
jgi:hypothetical protein